MSRKNGYLFLILTIQLIPVPILPKTEVLVYNDGVRIDVEAGMNGKKEALLFLKFMFFLLSFIGTIATLFWAFFNGNLLAAGLSMALILVLSNYLYSSFQESMSNFTKVELWLDEETTIHLERIRKYYEFNNIEDVVRDSLDLSVQALEEQTENDKILCFYDKKKHEIIAIDSMTSDGEIWESIEGVNERGDGNKEEDEGDSDEDKEGD